MNRLTQFGQRLEVSLQSAFAHRRACLVAFFAVAVLASACPPMGLATGDNDLGTPTAATATPEATARALDTTEAPASKAATVEPERVFVCEDGYQFSVAPSDLAVWLWPSDALEAFYLPEVDSGMGAKFEADGTTFWGRGNEALFEMGDEVHTGCVERPVELPWERARLRGVDFRAVGNEPGWLVELDFEATTRLELDYGRTQLTLPAVEVPSSLKARGLGFRSRDETHRLEVSAVRETCSDSMAGTAHGWEVEVVLDGVTYLGCGRLLVDP